MNGLATGPGALSAEARQARKRQLQDELSSIRLQKAEVLRRLEQVAKRLKTVEPAAPAGAGLPVATRRALLQQEHHKRGTGIMQQCGRLVADLLKNSNTRLYFGEPVKESYVPTYYQIIKHPMDLGTIKSEQTQNGRAAAEAAARSRKTPAASGSRRRACVRSPAASVATGSAPKLPGPRRRPQTSSTAASTATPTSSATTCAWCLRTAGRSTRPATLCAGTATRPATSLSASGCSWASRASGRRRCGASSSSSRWAGGRAGGSTGGSSSALGRPQAMPGGAAAS